MAIPTTQTATLIKTEALKKAIYSNPSTALLTRADTWLRMSLNRIFKGKDFKILEETKTSILEAYEQRYVLPADCDKLLGVHIYYGEETGDAQSATASSITLAADEGITEGTAKGSLIFLTSGTYKNQMARITAYNETTKVADITPNWENTPATEGYMIANTERILKPAPRENLKDVVVTAMPTYYFEYRRPKEIYFNSIVDSSLKYAMRLRYKLLINQVDLTDARMTEIYDELQEELIQGVYAQILKNDGHENAKTEWLIFEKMARDYRIKDGGQRVTRGNSFFKSVGGMPI